MNESPTPVPEPTVATADVAVANAGAFACHIYAEDFLAGYKALGPLRPKSTVPHYLLCHSIELSLKSFLRAQMVTRKEVKSRDLGHDLVAIYERAVALHLGRIVTLGAEEIELLRAANAYYASKDLEYLRVFKAMKGFSDLPDVESLEALAAKLLEATRQTALDAIHIDGPVHA
jgi:hypothetical protein